MKKPIHYFVRAFILFVSLHAICGSAWAADPALMYSDLNWGPRTGWDNSVFKGAAVSIWGRNFGAAVGASTVNIGGVRIPADNSTGMIAEWNVAGIARGDRRITFWIPPTATLGNQTISVTVGGITSNTLPFIVRGGAANIFYVSTTGSDLTSNGRSLSTPYQHIWKAFNPCSSTGDSSHHTHGSCNPLMDGEYIVYVRGGTYSTQDPGAYGGSYTAILSMFGPYGGETKRKALVGYPGETSVMSVGGLHYFVSNAEEAAFGPYDYFTYAKLDVVGNSVTEGMGDSFGYNNRFVGNKIRSLNASGVYSGLIYVGISNNTEIYGNLFQNNGGGDSNKHQIYIKAQNWGIGSQRNQGVYNTRVGFNEFDTITSTDNHGGQIFISRNSSGIDDTQFTDNVYIFNNYFHGGSQEPIYAGDTTALNPNSGGGHYYAYNNIISGGTFTNPALMGYCGGTYLLHAFNNTLYQPGAVTAPFVFAGDCGTGNVTTTLTNNIFYAISSSQSYGLIYQHSGGPVTTLNYAQDLFYNGSFINGGTSPIPSSANNVNYSGGYIGDPMFTNAAAADFTLQVGSPAVNAGINMISTLSGLPMVQYDYEGKLRPSTGNWDIGAIQYDAAPPSTPPAAPQNLRILP